MNENTSRFKQVWINVRNTMWPFNKAQQSNTKQKSTNASIRLTRASQLWLLVATAIVLAPLATHQSIMVTAFVVIVWSWAFWLAWKGLPQPGKILTICLAIAGTALTIFTYGTIFGRTGGVVLLELMLTLKLLELRTLRDAMLAVFLGFFVLMTHFLYSQAMFMGVYIFGAVWLLIGTLIALNRRDEPSLSHLSKAAGVILLQAIPLMLIFFLLVPRVQGPLWGMPKDTNMAISGLSDEMSPGSIGNLALSDAIAFRAEFEGKIPPSRALYWRAIVMENFDGRTWRTSRPKFNLPSDAIQGIGPAANYQITIEPHNRRWIFALDMPNKIPPNIRLSDNFQLFSRQPISSRARFEMSSYLSYRAGHKVEDNELKEDLQLPSGNPRTVALVKSFQSESASKQQVVQRALEYFRKQNFSYTLTPPLLNKDAIDEFMFQTKEGFCEHYASAFTFMMRAAGIPARVVAGYQGGEINPIGQYLIVRQADAHAWSEVWFPDRGWIRIDPTAMVAPGRVNNGSQVLSSAKGLLPGLITTEQLSWLRTIPLSWDAINNQWNQWVLGYDFEKQKQLLAKLGQKDASWEDLIIALITASGVVVLGLLAYLLYRRARHPKDPVLAIYEKFCRQLDKKGISRKPDEGPMDFAERASKAVPELAPAIEEISVLYIKLRYRALTLTALERFKQRVNRF